MTCSALHDTWSAGSAHLAEFCGVTTPLDFSNVRAEFDAVRSGCGIYDLSWRAKIALRGEDRVRWLNGMLTNNIRDLAESSGVYAFVLNPQGKIQADLYAYNRGDAILLDTDRSQLAKVLAIFDHYIIMDDVTISDLGEKLTALGVQGPNSAKILRGAGFEVPELQPLQVADITCNGVAVTVVRAEAWKGEAYELWLAPQDAAAIWGQLVEIGAVPCGTEAQRCYRMVAGVPRFGEDIRERDLPQETGQERALHFSKGCYVGQEIVERIRSRGQVRRIFGRFRLEGLPPAPGTKIVSAGKEVGEITSSANIPTSGGPVVIALGYIRREAMNQALQADTSEVKFWDGEMAL